LFPAKHTVSVYIGMVLASPFHGSYKAYKTLKFMQAALTGFWPALYTAHSKQTKLCISCRHIHGSG